MYAKAGDMPPSLTLPPSDRKGNGHFNKGRDISYWLKKQISGIDTVQQPGILSLFANRASHSPQKSNG
jgi:hypothetical protein